MARNLFLLSDKSIDAEIGKSYQQQGRSALFMPTASGQSISADEILASPYLSHYLIFSVCRAIALNVSKIPIKLHDKAKRAFVDDPKIIDLISAPNPFEDSMSFFERTVLGLLLPQKSNPKEGGGQVFIIGYDSRGGFIDFKRGQIPATLEQYSTVYHDKNYIVGETDSSTGQFLGWKFNDSKKPVLNSQIIRVRNVNPYSKLSGVSWFAPVYQEVYQDILSNVYNAEFFKNDCSVSGILKPKHNLTQQQIDTLYYSWMSKYSSAGNNRKLAILASDVEYQKIGVEPKDIQFIEQKKIAIDSVLASFGLNKIAIGQYESINYATIVEGRRMLYRDTYLPIAQKIVRAYNDQWIKYYNRNYELLPDLSEIPEARNDYSTAVPVYTALVNTGFPPSLACKKAGIELTEEEIAMYPWLNENPFNRYGAPVDTPEDDDEDDDDEDEGEDEGIAEDEEGKLSRQSSNKQGSITSITKLNYANYHFKKYINNNERQFEKSMNAFFDWQFKRIKKIVLDEVKNKTIKGIDYTTKQGIDIDDDMFDGIAKESNKKLRSIVKRTIVSVASTEAVSLADDNLGWYGTNKFFNKYLSARMKYIKEINSTTFNSVVDKVKKIIKEGIEDKLTTAEIAERIESKFGDIIEARKGSTSTIARTEVNTASSECRIDAFKENEIEYVEWSAFIDDKTRDTHIAANSHGPIKLGDIFPSTGMRYPLDNEGSLDNIINCRCVLIASQKP